LGGAPPPVPPDSIHIAEGGVLGWEAFPTPGHASHHVSYFRDGTLLAGDATGVRMPGSDYVLPVSPPPDIDVELWHATAAAIRAHSPERLALIHFGVYQDVTSHLDRFEHELDTWAERVGDGMELDEFVELARADAGADVEDYDKVAPLWQCWHGLKRYWNKKRETL
jgi:glyoxylase-like metal-dependent hydrolase (beta-lactamase superfamily II)